MESPSVIAGNLFRFLHSEGVRFCVVGDSRNYPEEIGSDIDIVVEPILVQRPTPGDDRNIRPLGSFVRSELEASMQEKTVEVVRNG